eukprot:1238021-Rhodomonas_salina.2
MGYPVLRSAMLLRFWYGICSTETGKAVTRRMLASLELLADQLPADEVRPPISLHASYAMSGTGTLYHAISLRASYGTD